MTGLQNIKQMIVQSLFDILVQLKVREHPVIGPYVEGLSSYVVKSFDDVSTWITIGNQRRATAATGINDNSSRSHSVFTLLLTQTRVSEYDNRTQSSGRTLI